MIQSKRGGKQPPGEDRIVPRTTEKQTLRRRIRLLLPLLLLAGCSSFSPDLLNQGLERERIVEDVLRRGRIYSLRPRDEEALAAFLQDDSALVRLTVLKIIDANPSPYLYDAVFRTLSDRDEGVAAEAEKILLEHWEEGARYAVLRGLNAASAEQVLNAVGLIDKKEARREAPYLLTVFSDPRQVIRSAASRSYAHLGSPEEDWFLSLLGHSSPLPRQTAVETLPRFRDPALITRLIPFIQDEDGGVRRAALFGLAEFDTAVLPFLHDALVRSEDDALRSDILQIVEGISDESSVPILVRLMSEENRRISLKSVEILLRLGADLVIPVLLERLDGMDRAALEQSFILAGRFQDVRMLPRLSASFNDPDPQLAELALETVRSYGPAAAPYLLSRLGADSPVRREALGILVENREPRLVYDEENQSYRADNIFLLFEEVPEEELLAYLSALNLPSRVAQGLWGLYDIETNAQVYRRSRTRARYGEQPYFYHYRQWEESLLAAEASRSSSFTYMQDFFETDDEKWLSESRVLRNSADWYKRGAARSFDRAQEAAAEAPPEEKAALEAYLESRRSLVSRWRTLPGDVRELARLIFLRSSLDIESLAREYDFFRSLPQERVPR